MDKTQRTSAMVTGVSLLVMAILAGIAFGYIFGSIYVPGNAELTYNHLQGATSSFKLMIWLWVIIAVLDLVIAGTLYLFFKNINKPLSLLMGWVRVIYTVFLAVAIFNFSDTLQLLASGERNEVAVMDTLVSFLDVWSWGLIVFGIHLFLLGLLILKSKGVPNILGVLAVIAGVGYFGSNLMNLLWTDYINYKEAVDQVLAAPMALGELILAGWFIVKVVVLKKRTQLKSNYGSSTLV